MVAGIPSDRENMQTLGAHDGRYSNITDQLVAFVWEDIGKIIDQMSEDLLRPIESIKPIKKGCDERFT